MTLESQKGELRQTAYHLMYFGLVLIGALYSFTIFMGQTFFFSRSVFPLVCCHLYVECKSHNLHSSIFGILTKYKNVMHLGTVSLSAYLCVRPSICPSAVSVT